MQRDKVGCEMWVNNKVKMSESFLIKVIET